LAIENVVIHATQQPIMPKPMAVLNFQFTGLLARERHVRGKVKVSLLMT
jgi:hypothetical protein